MEKYPLDKGGQTGSHSAFIYVYATLQVMFTKNSQVTKGNAPITLRIFNYTIASSARCMENFQ